MFIAESYIEQLKSAFKFSTKQSFCQAATIAKQNNHYMPKSRTVLLYLEEERHVFHFTCSTQTHKWAELKAIPKMTGIYFDQDNVIQYQYQFEADAILIDNSVSDEKLFYEKTWKNLRPDLRHVL